MKFFIDSANTEHIKKAIQYGLCDGITTNPTLIAKEGKNLKSIIEEIVSITKVPISVETTALTKDEIISDAYKFSKWAPNIVIKIAFSKEGIEAAKELEENGIKTNITLVFTLSQALIAAKINASYVSPFVGRLEDNKENGIALISDIVKVYNNYSFKTQIIAASIRSRKHVEEVSKIGVHIATIPFNVLEEMYYHELTEKGIEKFLEDSKKYKVE